VIKRFEVRDCSDIGATGLDGVETGSSMAQFGPKEWLFQSVGAQLRAECSVNRLSDLDGGHVRSEVDWQSVIRVIDGFMEEIAPARLVPPKARSQPEEGSTGNVRDLECCDTLTTRIRSCRAKACPRYAYHAARFPEFGFDRVGFLGLGSGSTTLGQR
jgi:hypothetical protein